MSSSNYIDNRLVGYLDGMGQVQANMAKLPQADVEAIAEYLISLK